MSEKEPATNLPPEIIIREIAEAVDILLKAARLAQKGLLGSEISPETLLRSRLNVVVNLPDRITEAEKNGYPVSDELKNAIKWLAIDASISLDEPLSSSVFFLTPKGSEKDQRNPLYKLADKFSPPKQN